MELNLTPMMNLIAMLIPVLLVSMVFVELSVINVSAPAIGSSPETANQEKPSDKPPLNLTVTITEKGYTLSGAGEALAAQVGQQEPGPTVPAIQKSVNCAQFVGTWPPPRSRNREAAPCEGTEERTFWVYDQATLTEKLVQIKDDYPDERRVIIAAEADIDYEAITNLMDASRDVQDPGGDVRVLFDEVVLSPGLS